MNPNIEVKIMQDDNPASPLEHDNYGIMFCSHSKYDLGDEQIPKEDFNSWDEIEEYLIKEREAVIVLPLYLYDHSGISISTRSFVGRSHHGAWDSGQVGFIYTTREQIETLMGWKNLTKARLAQIKKYLLSEVETYNQFLTGDVYGYSISIDGEHVDSCWGFFGQEYAKEEAISVAGFHLKKELENNLEVSYA